MRIALLQIRDVAESATREVWALKRNIRIDGFSLKPVNVLLGDDWRTALDGCGALIIGGSGYSVFEDMPMRDQLVELSLRARQAGLPIFGICFGAQLLAYAYGGRVVRDYENRERGTFDIDLTDDGMSDPLFCSAPKRFAAQCSHQDKIVELPSDAKILASSKRCSVQAFAIPDCIYAVQFHPERTKHDMECIFNSRTQEIRTANGGISPGGAPLRESLHSTAILRRFMENLC